MRFVVYAGPNGAGKSSLRAGGDDPVEIEIDPDRIARQIDPADPHGVRVAAGREALRLFDLTLNQGRSLSLETTLAGHTVMARMQAAKTAGYDVTLRYVGLTNATLYIERVTARAVQGGHWIDPDTVRRRVTSSLENLPAAIAIADQSLVIDNSGASHRQLLRVHRGKITFEAPDLPRWLAGQMQAINAELGHLERQSRDAHVIR